MMRHNSAIGIFMLVVAALAASLYHPRITAGQPGKLKIITTLFPLYDMARAIGADKAEVTLLLPPGVEPHSFEPKPTDIVKIHEADIFIFTGKFMEPWAAEIAASIDNPNLIVVDVSRDARMAPWTTQEQIRPDAAVDPHIWLDFDNAKMMVSQIAGAMEEKDPVDQEYFQRHADSYENQLTRMDSTFRAILSSCDTKVIVYGGHYAFGYLARRYGLNYLAAQGISPDAEPSASDLTRLIDQIRREKIKYVFYEELTSPRIAETIAEETDARLLPLNAAHNVTRDQLESGVTFFDILKTDLENLRIGLECR